LTYLTYMTPMWQVISESCFYRIILLLCRCNFKIQQLS